MSKQIELIQSLSLGIILAVAVSIGCGFLVGVCYAFYEVFVEGRAIDQYEQLRVLSDGRPLIEVRQYRPQRQTKYLDVDRNPVQIPDEPEWLDGAYLPESLRTSLGFNRRGPQARIISVVQAELSVDQERHGTEDWYFVF